MTNETDRPTEEQSDSIIERGGVDTDARAGRSMGIDLTGPPPGMTEEEVDAERKRRLDPANRPEGAEVDNTGRKFDVERGEYLDTQDTAADEAVNGQS